MCLVFLMFIASLAFSQTATTQAEKAKPSDFEPSVVKIVVFGIGPTGYTSVGTGFFIGDHSIASAAHVYLEAARAIVDGGNGTIAALKVFETDGRCFSRWSFGQQILLTT